MADDLKGIRMHKQIAMGGSMPTGDFGVEKLDSKSAGGPGRKEYSGTLKDDDRAARSPIDGNQANPNHGYGED